MEANWVAYTKRENLVEEYPVLHQSRCQQCVWISPEPGTRTWTLMRRQAVTVSSASVLRKTSALLCFSLCHLLVFSSAYSYSFPLLFFYMVHWDCLKMVPLVIFQLEFLLLTNDPLSQFRRKNRIDSVSIMIYSVISDFREA